MPSQWVTFSFKCHETKDAELVELLAGIKQGRSGFIRRKLYLGLRMNEMPEPDVLSAELLRAEIDRAVKTILSNIGTGLVVVPQSEEQTRRTDVNDNGDRIPNF